MARRRPALETFEAGILGGDRTLLSRAITLVSDFLVKHDVVPGLNELASSITDNKLELTHNQIVSRSKESRPAQWVLLLYRLADTISDKRSEVRNTSFQITN